MSFGSRLEIELHKLSFGAGDRADAWQLLANLTESKLDIGFAFELAGEIYDLQGKRSVAVIMRNLREAVGLDQFEKVMSDYAGSAEMLLFSGYEHVDADRLFAAASRIMRNSVDSRRAILAAAAGPFVVMAALAALLWIMGAQLFPVVLELAPVEQWPPVSRVIAAVSLWYVDNLLVIGLGTLALAAVLTWNVRTYVGVGRVTLDRLPPWSMYRLLQGTAFTLVLVEQARMGVPLNAVLLERMAERASPYASHRIRAIANCSTMDERGIGSAGVKAGHGFPSPVLCAVMAALAHHSSQNWVNQFAEYTDRWILDNEVRVKARAKVVNYVLLFAAAGFIAMFMYTIFSVITIIQTSI